MKNEIKPREWSIVEWTERSDDIQGVPILKQRIVHGPPLNGEQVRVIEKSWVDAEIKRLKESLDYHVNGDKRMLKMCEDKALAYREQLAEAKSEIARLRDAKNVVFKNSVKAWHEELAVEKAKSALLVEALEGVVQICRDEHRCGDHLWKVASRALKNFKEKKDE